MDASEIAVALDGLPEKQIVAAVRSMCDEAHYKPILKVNDLWDRDPDFSPKTVPGNLIEWIAERGDLWVDMKLCDIPKTMENRARAIVARGAKYLTILAANTAEAIHAAVEGAKPAKVLAVTVLTSWSDIDCTKLYGDDRRNCVTDLAYHAILHGVYGIVCSVAEIEALQVIRKGLPEMAGYPRLFVPGIRPAWHMKADDQKRTGTPAEAIAAGADVLVMGRPILEAEGLSPAEALCKTLEEIGGM